MRRCVTAWKIFGGALAATSIPLCAVTLYHGQGAAAISDALIYAGPAAIGLAIFIASDVKQKEQDERAQEDLPEQQDTASPHWQSLMLLALAILALWALLLAAYLLTPVRP